MKYKISFSINGRNHLKEVVNLRDGLQEIVRASLAGTVDGVTIYGVSNN